jgi:hypothetical protein
MRFGDCGAVKEGTVTGETGRIIHVRNGAGSNEALAAAFGDLGLSGIVIEEIPGVGREIEMHTRVAALLADLGRDGEGAGATFARFNDTLWTHLGDPAIRLLLVDTETDITAILAPNLPEGAYDALATLDLGTVEKFGIVAYDAARDAWVQQGVRR